MSSRQLAAVREELESSLSSLRHRWEEARAVWDDGTQRHFESRYWSELDSGTSRWLQELAELEEALADAERELS